MIVRRSVSARRLALLPVAAKNTRCFALNICDLPKIRSFFESLVMKASNCASPIPPLTLSSTR